jgi:hypothetical protein
MRERTGDLELWTQVIALQEVGNVLVDGRIQAIAGNEELHIVHGTQCAHQWQEEINALLPAHQTTGPYHDCSRRCR